MVWTSRVLTLLVWAGVGWMTATLIYAGLSPSSDGVLPLVATQQTRVATSLTALDRAFGASGGTQAKVKASDVRMVGLMAGPRGGVVSISIRNGPVRQLTMGRTESDGWRFEALEDGEVVLSSGGSIVRLPAHAPKNGLATAP